MKMKNGIETINSRMDQAEEKIGELEGRKFDIMCSEENKEKSMKHSEESLRDIWDTIKKKIVNCWSSRRKQREKRAESLFINNSQELPKYGERFGYPSS